MALSLRKNSDAGTVGLDIDGRFLAAATLDGDRVASVAVAELPTGALADGEVADREALTEALKDFVAENKLSRHVRLGVSNQQIVVRVLELPRIDDDSERDAALRFQAAEAIAMPLDEAVLDHQVAGYLEAPDGSERMQVVVVAARRTMIEEYLGAAKDAGLKVEGIDLDAFALVRMLAEQARVTPAPLPPVEPVVEAPVPVEPVAEPAPAVDEDDTFAASPVPSDVADGLSDDGHPSDPPPAPDPTFPFDEAAPEAAPAVAEPAYAPEPLADTESARVICHLGGVSNLAIAVGSTCYFSRTLSTPFDAEGAGSRLADEIRLSIDYYMAQPNALGVGDVLLSGSGGSDVLAAEIGAQLGLPVGIGAPLGSLDTAALPADEDLHRYTVAAGLALGEAA